MFTNFASATNPISVEAYHEQFTSEESGKKLVKWWKAAKASVVSISKWALAIGILSGPVIILAILADIEFIGYLAILLMIASLILGIIVLFNRDKSNEDYKKSKFRALLGIVFALTPIAIGILFLLTFSL